MSDHDCPHAATLRNLLDACDRGRPLADITDRLRVEVGRLGGGEGIRNHDYDHGYRQGFRDGLRQNGHDIDVLIERAGEGPPHRPPWAGDDVTGSTLLLGIWFPNCPPDTDPEIVADCVAVIVNEERDRNDGTEGAVEVAGIPAPQWLTPETLANLKRAASGEGTAPPPDEDHGVRLVHFGCDECKQVGRVVTKLGPECLHCDLPRGHAGDCVPMVWPQPGTTPRIEPVRIDTPDDDERGAPQVPAEADQHAILRSWGWAPTLAGDTWLPPREPETERLCSKSFARPPENHTTPVPDSEGWGSCNACGAVLNTQGQQVPQHDVRVVAADCAPPEETET